MVLVSNDQWSVDDESNAEVCNEKYLMANNEMNIEGNSINERARPWYNV